MKDLNRLKVVLVEQKKTGKWLAEQLGKDPSTVSKWCSNKMQPSLEIHSKAVYVGDTVANSESTKCENKRVGKLESLFDYAYNLL